MYTYAWYHWITFFYLYCFFGWIFESTYVSFKQHHFVNRGFLRLPMLPLYGSGAILLLWVSLPYQDNLILVYIAGFIAATALEYVTGAVMERLFKVRYWDYSDKKFNINGYICLGSSIAWGFLTIFMTEVIHKPIADFVTSLNPVVEFTFIAVVSVLFVYDTVRSTKEALDLARVLESMTKLKTEAEELQIKDKEGKRILEQIKDGAFVIALAINGNMLDSVELAERIDKLGIGGVSQLVFVIGGSLGLSEAVLSRADYKLSFSRMTFPHQLMRVILLEQIYRSYRIIHKEPYHK
mgnify:FL=1